jgi:VanZ family protein
VKTTVLNNGRIYLVMLVIYLIMIFAVSSLHAQYAKILTMGIKDKILHFIEYIPVGFFIAGWLTFVKSSYKKKVLLSALIIVCLSAFDELHQYFVPSRDSDIHDIFADFAGGMTGVALFSVWQFIKGGKTFIGNGEDNES